MVGSQSPPIKSPWVTGLENFASAGINLLFFVNNTQTTKNYMEIISIKDQHKGFKPSASLGIKDASGKFMAPFRKVFHRK